MSAGGQIRIVLSGPESSGKSTLAAELSARSGMPMAPEYARAYLEAGGPYPRAPEDLAALARAHLEWQGEHVPDDASCGILDTDLLNYCVWSDVAFGPVPAELVRGFGRERDHIHLLCAPDLPWEPDPLREFPGLESRQELFRRHQAELERHGIRHTIIRGTGDLRLSRAIAALDAMGAHGVVAALRKNALGPGSAPVAGSSRRIFPGDFQNGAMSSS